LSNRHERYYPESKAEYRTPAQLDRDDNQKQMQIPRRGQRSPTASKLFGMTMKKESGGAVLHGEISSGSGPQ
jgi:hypothetical protein